MGKKDELKSQVDDAKRARDEAVIARKLAENLAAKEKAKHAKYKESFQKERNAKDEVDTRLLDTQAKLQKAEDNVAELDIKVCHCVLNRTCRSTSFAFHYKNKGNLAFVSRFRNCMQRRVTPANLT